LAPEDFDARLERADGWERLADVCDELERDHAEDVQGISRLLLGFVERVDGADLGSPGPIVHMLERLPGYEVYLKESLARKPAWLTVWMANRILNASPGDRSEWLDFLRAAADDERLPSETRQQARELLHYQ
jgi:hypothetical protein